MTSKLYNDATYVYMLCDLVKKGNEFFLILLKPHLQEKLRNNPIRKEFTLLC